MRNGSAIVLALLVLALITFGRSQFDASGDHNDLRIWFFDVGQGDAMLLETPEKQQILIDGGPNGRIVEHLNRNLPFGDKELDLVVVTHNHADHITGIVEVLRHYRVKQIWLSGAIHTTSVYQQLLEEIRDRSIPTQAVQAGVTARFGTLQGIVLFPFELQTGVLPDDQNALSVVTYWQYGQSTFLATGDMNVAEEGALLARGVIHPTTILKVAHQGSKTSSSEQILRALTPKYAIISVGKNNYGHPHQEVLRRFQALSIPVLRTDQLGTIECRVSEVAAECGRKGV